MKVIAIAVILAVAGVAGLLIVSDTTAVNFTAPVKNIGVTTPVSVQLSNPHGVRRISAYVEQDGARYSIFEKSSPSHHFVFSGNAGPQTVTFDAGKDKAPNLKEGKARLVVEAVSNDFRGSTTTAASDVDVILAAPRVIADDLQHYINQ
ncbi:MAG TPA: hypothetical protein VKV17_13740, partial [Bryobacteraceae bacterium]|nr:hypothetical protein [Bryobacteraceae bacterium]